MTRRTTVHAHVVCYVLTAAAVCLPAGGPASGAEAASTSGLWDSQRYIGLDEIKPGMKAYCLTDYGEAGIEKFELKILNVVRDLDPGYDVILVMGLDERFKHTGSVAGCSGSPVYVEGRLAGALALAFNFSKDPLYGVRPIADMLEVGVSGASTAPAHSGRSAAFSVDLSRPIDLAEIDRQFTAAQTLATRRRSGATTLPCPLLVSGLPSEACEQMVSQFEAMGFVAAPAVSGVPGRSTGPAGRFEPGSTLTIPLVAGDIKVSSLGTVTEVRGNRIYGFGHSFIGHGATNLPLATGQVYTVVSRNLMTSMKLGAPGEIIGAINFDEATAVVGDIGAACPMIPLTVHTDLCNGIEPRTYNCQVINDPMFTPTLVRTAVSSAAIPFGSAFPPDHTVRYTAKMELDDGRWIEFSNISTGMELAEPVAEIAGSLALLMNNPYGGAKVKSLDFGVSVEPRNIASYLWSVDVANPKVKRGEDIEIDVVLESFLKEKRKHQVRLTVPKSVSPGRYNLMLLGVYEYESFIQKAAPYRLLATNHRTLVEALNNALNVDRGKLYCLLVLPPDGIALETAELPNLPQTKSMILQSAKRAVPVQPCPQWVEVAIETGTVISDKATVPITVEP